MTNVIQLNAPSYRQSHQDVITNLMATFSAHRRYVEDVYWLKENAELLSILEATGAQPNERALAYYSGFYQELPSRMRFFPQYYRFLLSIALDLEDLGLQGDLSYELCDWAAQKHLATGELSDLQRAEARRLMQRRGVDPMAHDLGLETRLRDFISNTAMFTLPNRRAAVELTHIVFYLSEYGRRDPCLCTQAITSLHYAGTLAFLDQNADLLAEVCIALRYAGQEPSEIWESWLIRVMRDYSVINGPSAAAIDDYHEFFVTNWALRQMGGQGFSHRVDGEAACFRRPHLANGPLRDMSEVLFLQGDERNSDWTVAKPAIAEVLNEGSLLILDQAEVAIKDFGHFFEGFARAI